MERLFYRKEHGFTIVELLIVIVVIAILAAITIVAFNGVQTQAKETAVISAVRNASGKVQEYEVNNGSYPVNLAALQVTDPANVSYDYRADNVQSRKSWCVAAVNGDIIYHATQANTAPKKGQCPAVQRVITQKGATSTSCTAGVTPCNYVSIRTELFTAGQYQVRCLRNGSPASSFVNVNLPPSGTTQLNCFVGGTGVSVAVEVQNWGTSEPLVW